MKVIAFISLLFLSAGSAAVQAAGLQQASWPAGYTVVTVPLGPELRSLQLVAWEGKPVTGPLLYSTFHAPFDPKIRRDARSQSLRYKQESENYLFLLSLIKQYADNPQDFAPTSPKLGYVWSQAADAFLADSARSKYLQCPEKGLSGAPACATKVSGPLRDWKGANEFDAEDSRLAFAKVFQKFMAGATKAVPLEFWNIYEVNLGTYTPGSPMGYMRFQAVSGSNLPHVTKLVNEQHPSYYQLGRDEARKIVESLSNGNKAFVISGLSLAVQQSSFSPEESFVDWQMNSLRLFKSMALKELVYTFDSTRSMR